MIIYHNGSFIDGDALHIAPNDRGLTLGDGVFDTMLATGGEPVWAREHFARLAYNASVLGISFALDFLDTATELLRRNDFTHGRFAIRTTVTRGPGARGLMPPDIPHPTIIMSASPAPIKNHRAELIIAETVRRNEFSPLTRIKSLNYGDNLLALLEATQKEAEDAILLNTKGMACCATTSNIFLRENGRYITPPLADGVLSGIAREKLIGLSGAAEESIPPARLFEADAVFLTNSIQGVRAVKRIGNTYFRQSEAPVLEDVR